MTYNVAVLVGSLRRESINRKTALALAKMAPESLKLGIVEIGDLPLYDEDVEPEAPQSWVDFRNQVKAADAVLFVTPEYNRGIPGCLKNAIDVGSRPYGASVWNDKPGGVISVSPGAVGGFGANHAVRQCCVFLNVHLLQQPEAYLGGAGDMFDANGDVKDEGKRKFLTSFITAYAAWVERLLGGRA